MKRLIFILLSVLLFFTNTQAQNKPIDHLKFMSIPINGTVNSFQTKLEAKGFKISPVNKVAEVGTRVFDGQFMNKKAMVAVYYNSQRNNQVNSVRVIFDREVSETEASSFVDDLTKRLESKYEVEAEDDKLSDEKAKNVHSFNLPNGIIYVWMKLTSEYYEDEAYKVFIQYYDRLNSIADYEKENEDL